MKKLFFLILILSFKTYGQQIKGYLYSSEGRVVDLQIFNATQNLYTFSDSNGYFQISANVGDSIFLHSIAYSALKMEVNKNHFENDIVIEVSAEKLGEVTINSSIIKLVDIETVEREVRDQIEKDILRNPSFYEPSKGNIGHLLQKIFDLFKIDGKAKGHRPVERKLITKDFKLLFENDPILNCKFLLEELQIPIENHNLFFDYLSTQEFSYTYLEGKNRLDLIDLIYKFGEEFKEIINSEKN